MFANCQLQGLDAAPIDVCLTPAPPSPTPVPVPYPNMASGPMAIPNLPNILFSGAPAHNLATLIPMTEGDDAGLAMGLASGTVMGPSRHLTGSFTVKLQGMPATRLGSQTLQNSTNAIGARIVPSQFIVSLLAP